jgi:hypothetical protein
MTNSIIKRRQKKHITLGMYFSRKKMFSPKTGTLREICLFVFSLFSGKELLLKINNEELFLN